MRRRKVTTSPLEFTLQVVGREITQVDDHVGMFTISIVSLPNRKFFFIFTTCPSGIYLHRYL